MSAEEHAVSSAAQAGEGEGTVLPFFRDAQGRTWTVRLDVNVLRSIRRNLNVDVLTLAGLDRLADNPIMLCDVAWECCREQAEARELTIEHFGRAINGDAIEELSRALLEAVADFTPRRYGRRNALRKLAATAEKVAEAQMAEVHRLIDSGEIERRLRQMRPAGSESTNSPELPELTQDPIPGEN